VAYDLEEQEQIEQFKAWWAKYGNVITGVIALAALVSLGNFGWNWYQNRQASEASAVYEQLQQAIVLKNASLIRDTTGVLLDKYGGTPYAEMAALVAAHANAEAGDTKTA
jgi:predicted negative regulator of RcsB-dependent stress response